MDQRNSLCSYRQLFARPRWDLGGWCWYWLDYQLLTDESPVPNATSVPVVHISTINENSCTIMIWRNNHNISDTDIAKLCYKKPRHVTPQTLVPNSTL